jgi:hypothetical protein
MNKVPRRRRTRTGAMNRVQRRRPTRSRAMNRVPRRRPTRSRAMNRVPRREEPGARAINRVPRRQEPGARAINRVPRRLEPGARAINTVPRREEPGARAMNRVPRREEPGARAMNRVPRREEAGAETRRRALRGPATWRETLSADERHPTEDRGADREARAEAQSREVSGGARGEDHPRFHFAAPRLGARPSPRTNDAPRRVVPPFERRAQRRRAAKLRGLGRAVDNPGSTSRLRGLARDPVRRRTTPHGGSCRRSRGARRGAEPRSSEGWAEQ